MEWTRLGKRFKVGLGCPSFPIYWQCNNKVSGGVDGIRISLLGLLQKMTYNLVKGLFVQGVLRVHFSGNQFIV